MPAAFAGRRAEADDAGARTSSAGPVVGSSPVAAVALDPEITQVRLARVGLHAGAAGPIGTRTDASSAEALATGRSGTEPDAD